MRSRNSKYRQYNGKEGKDKEMSVLRITASDYLFIFSLFSILLFVLRITASDYLFIFSLFSIVLSVLKEVMRSRNSKYRQYNGKERKD
jgi:hypothetical protein